MDHFEKYHFNQMLSRAPLAANGNNFGEWFHHMVSVLKNTGKEQVLNPMDADDETHGGPHMFCEECIVKELMQACIEPELGELFYRSSSLPAYGSIKSSFHNSSAH